jgi:glycine cleavage system T protein (aminomethyltransferase)
MSDVSSRAYLPTPLHVRTAELCTTNAWTAQCGFTVPATYTSASEEHAALTGRVALSDLSARQYWLIEGKDAAAYLSAATMTDASALEPGQTARTLWCDDDGQVRGEGLIARFAESAFELSTGVRDFAWLADGARGFDAKVTNATGTRAVIGLRGPRASDLLAAAGLSGGPASTGNVVRPAWRPAQVALVRDGDGFELWTHADDATVVWDRLWRSGAAFGVAAAGADVLETLRIENAVPRAGLDWQPAHLAKDLADRCVPADLGFAPDPARRFNGADALARAKPGRGQMLVQLTSEATLAPGPVSLRGAVVGRLTSSAWSLSRAAAVALAWLEADAAKTGTVVQAGAAAAEVARDVFPKEL